MRTLLSACATATPLAPCLLVTPVAGLEGAGVAKILPDNRTAVILLHDERVAATADLVTRRVVARHELSGPRPDAAAWEPAR